MPTSKFLKIGIDQSAYRQAQILRNGVGCAVGFASFLVEKALDVSPFEIALLPACQVSHSDTSDVRPALNLSKCDCIQHYFVKFFPAVLAFNLNNSRWGACVEIVALGIGPKVRNFREFVSVFAGHIQKWNYGSVFGWSSLGRPFPKHLSVKPINRNNREWNHNHQKISHENFLPIIRKEGETA